MNLLYNYCQFYFSEPLGSKLFQSIRRKSLTQVSVVLISDGWQIHEFTLQLLPILLFGVFRLKAVSGIPDESHSVIQ